MHGAWHEQLKFAVQIDAQAPVSIEQTQVVLTSQTMTCYKAGSAHTHLLLRAILVVVLLVVVVVVVDILHVFVDQGRRHIPVGRCVRLGQQRRHLLIVVVSGTSRIDRRLQPDCRASALRDMIKTVCSNPDPNPAQAYGGDKERFTAISSQ